MSSCCFCKIFVYEVFNGVYGFWLGVYVFGCEGFIGVFVYVGVYFVVVDGMLLFGCVVVLE